MCTRHLCFKSPVPVAATLVARLLDLNSYVMEPCLPGKMLPIQRLELLGAAPTSSRRSRPAVCPFSRGWASTLGLPQTVSIYPTPRSEY